MLEASSTSPKRTPVSISRSGTAGHEDSPDDKVNPETRTPSLCPRPRRHFVEQRGAGAVPGLLEEGAGAGSGVHEAANLRRRPPFGAGAAVQARLADRRDSGHGSEHWRSAAGARGQG